MKPLDPQRVREAFAAAIEGPRANRAAVLAALCGDDTALRVEVESLLAHHDQTHGPLADADIGLAPRLANAVADPPNSAGPPHAGSRLPERIGHYRVLRLLGAGGMGVVYLAEQDQPRRTVAVKLMRSDVLTPELLKRFRREAQLLARLQHPGIAHIYDAGVASLDGLERAYFAMEYIDGVPLTEYAQNAALDQRRRLELVATVCDAVQHAHERGVIHRDLKPGNILVDAAGRVRILDFGVAAAGGPGPATASLQTQPGQLIGTLQYMSPEQVSGASDQIDARSDVYALGVIAFELLTGRPPYDVRAMSLAQIARTIQEVEPTRIGTVDTRFRGDVDVMLAKALEKDRNRRYASAAAFAADLRRHLTDQPIVARPATTLYRFRKFAQRNKALVGGTAIAFAALSAGLAATTSMYVQADAARRQAEEQRGIAQRESAIARAANQFVVEDMLAAPNPWTTGGRDTTVAAVLDRAAAVVGQRFAAAPEVEAAVRATLGESYAALGLFAEAQPHLDRSEELVAKSGDRLPLRLAATRRRAANLQSLGRFDEAQALIDEVRHALSAEGRDDSPEHAQTLETLADIQIGKSLYAEAEASMREAVRIRRLQPQQDELGLAYAQNTLGSTLHYRGDLPQAERIKLEALELFRRRVGESHPLVAQVLHDLGSGMVEQHRYADAIAYFEQALPILLRELGPEHRVALSCERSLATALSFAGGHAEATPRLERAIADTERTLGAEHPETLAAINCLATAYLRTNQPEQAGVLLERLLGQAERSLGARHAETLKYRHNLAWCRQKTNRLDEAEEQFRRCLADFEATLGPLHPDTCQVLDGLAWNMERRKRYAEAAEFLQRMLDRRELAGVAPDMETARYLIRLGTLHMQSGDYAAAYPHLSACVDLCNGSAAPFDFRAGIARGKLGETLSKLGEFAAAEAHLRQSLEIARENCASSPADILVSLERLRTHYTRCGAPEKAAALPPE